jgi:NitT/TauT family transport system substrate-binding protein
MALVNACASFPCDFTHAAVLTVFSESSPAVAKANIDVSKTYTNAFVEQAGKAVGTGAK